MGLTIEKVIEIGIRAGVKEAQSILEKERLERNKKRYDRRLRNTRLLLQNYNNFVEHCKNAVYVSTQIKDLNAIDILDECETIDKDEMYINAIKRTKERTYIIVKHIETILDFYKYKAVHSGDKRFMRRYTATYAHFIKGKSYRTIAEEFKNANIDMSDSNNNSQDDINVCQRTIARDIKKSIEELSVLLFGVDGLKLE